MYIHMYHRCLLAHRTTPVTIPSRSSTTPSRSPRTLRLGLGDVRSGVQFFVDAADLPASRPARSRRRRRRRPRWNGTAGGGGRRRRRTPRRRRRRRGATGRGGIPGRGGPRGGGRGGGSEQRREGRARRKADDDGAGEGELIVVASNFLAPVAPSRFAVGDEPPSRRTLTVATGRTAREAAKGEGERERGGSEGRRGGGAGATLRGDRSRGGCAAGQNRPPSSPCGR